MLRSLVGSEMCIRDSFGCSPLVFEFAKDCLEPNPEKRPTAKELLSYALVTDGGSAQQANKLLRKARLLHILNQFVAFQDPDEITSGESSSYDSEEYSDGGSADFFNSSDNSDDNNNHATSGEDEDNHQHERTTSNLLEETSGPSDLGGSTQLLGGGGNSTMVRGNSTIIKSPRKVVLSKRAMHEMSKTDFFSSSDEDEDDNDEDNDKNVNSNPTIVGTAFPVIGADDTSDKFAPRHENFKKSAPLDNDSFTLPTARSLSTSLPFAHNAPTTPQGILTQSKYTDGRESRQNRFTSQDMMVSASGDMGGSTSRTVSPTLLSSLGRLPSVRRTRSPTSSTPSSRQAVINIIGADESTASEYSTPSPGVSGGNLDESHSPTLSVFIPRLVSNDNTNTKPGGGKGASPKPSPRAGYSGDMLFGATRDGPASRSQSFSRASRTASILRKRSGSPSGAMVRSGSIRRQQRQQQMADEYHSVFQRSISGVEDCCDRSQVENSNSEAKSIKGSAVLVPSMGGSTMTEDSSSLNNTANSMSPKRVAIGSVPPPPLGQSSQGVDDSLVAASSSLVKSLHGMGLHSINNSSPSHRLSSDAFVGEGSSQTFLHQGEGFAMLKRSGITSPTVDALHFSTMPVSPRDEGQDHKIVDSDTE
eukprot:TRINITY_DN3453_c0_g1_i2.p1 TRINITY_DN3453_c0_g1~~TRINITY_DN3453_c0_g1_i2.p1  ORF type:complete len:681 (-),score=122.47 TRINITY_DN3453_c0_g1_i2:322-2259(-)